MDKSHLGHGVMNHLGEEMSGEFGGELRESLHQSCELLFIRHSQATPPILFLDQDKLTLIGKYQTHLRRKTLRTPVRLVGSEMVTSNPLIPIRRAVVSVRL